MELRSRKVSEYVTDGLSVANTDIDVVLRDEVRFPDRVHCILLCTS